MKSENKGKFPRVPAANRPLDVSKAPALPRRTVTLSAETYQRLMNGAEYSETVESRIKGLLDLCGKHIVPAFASKIR